MAKTDSVIRHVVMFKFNDTATEEDIEKIVEKYRALPNEIEGIIGFEGGKEESGGNQTEGFTHCFLLTFRNMEDVKKYGPHPAHEAFKKAIRPYLEKVLVFDYHVPQ